jgi:ribosomal-protein-alanine N-acetyltransferase
MATVKRAKPKYAILVGPRVYIRTPKLHDLEEYIDLNRASTGFYRGWASPMLKPEQFIAYVKRCSQNDFEGFLICRIEDDVIVGSINLSQIFRGLFKSAYMGYQVGEPYAGRGYMTEAIDLVLRFAFVKLKLHRIEANIQPTNIASIALAKRAGFMLEGYSPRYLKIAGRWRDHERWAILVEDWRGKRKRLTTKNTKTKKFKKII